MEAVQPRPQGSVKLSTQLTHREVGPDAGTGEGGGGSDEQARCYLGNSGAAEFT